jgi:spore coat protein CotH
VHEIRLAINTRDWQALKDGYLENTYYPADFRWRDQVVRNIGIRSRGTGSRSPVKPGLRVDFDRYSTTKKFLGLKSFVLRNNVQDPTNLRERVSMLLFRRLGLPASREAHARLYVNDQYAGLYTIVESIDKNYLARTYGEDSGYLFKYDYPADAAPYYFEDRGNDAALYVPLPFQPETHESDPRPEFVLGLVQAINGSSDAAFQSEVGSYLDLRKALRHIATEVFIGDYDGFLGNTGMNNYYTYRFDNQKRFEMIPWDKSEAYAAGPESSVFHNITDLAPAQVNRLVSRALAFPDLYGSFLDSLLDAAASASEGGGDDPRGWLEREIQHEYNQIRDAARADTMKPQTNEQFEQGVVDLLDFARRRSDIVRGEVAASRR